MKHAHELNEGWTVVGGIHLTDSSLSNMNACFLQSAPYTKTLSFGFYCFICALLINIHQFVISFETVSRSFLY